MGLECTKCKASVTDPIDLKWQSWIRLMNFLYIENLQGNISDNLYSQLTDDLMWFKPDYMFDEK